MEASDRSLSIGSRASILMRTYCRSASPRAYELWYTYVTGLKAPLNVAVKRLITSRQMLSSSDVDTLYETHIAGQGLAAETERASSGLLLEMGQVMGLIEAALGSTAEYGASLEALSSDLNGSVGRNRLRDIAETLLAATRTVAASNADLEKRLQDSKSEIDGLRKALDEVKVESLTDPLTGIGNRKLFEVTLSECVALAQRELSTLVLVVVDIDHFKRFNDTYGHLTGDQVLRLVSAAMRESVDAGSTLARFGGEEFAMILPSVSREEAFGCAEKIRRNVMGRELRKRSTNESLGRVTVSLGIASLRPDDTPSSLLDRADLCMYAAKQAGRNRTVTDEERAESLSSAA